MSIFDGIPAPPGGWIPGTTYTIMGEQAIYPVTSPGIIPMTTNLAIQTVPTIDAYSGTNLFQPAPSPMAMTTTSGFNLSSIPFIGPFLSSLGGTMTTIIGLYGLWQTIRKRRLTMLNSGMIMLAIISNWSRIKSWLPQNRDGSVNTAMTLASLIPGTAGNVTRTLLPGVASWGVGLASILFPLTAGWIVNRFFKSKRYGRRFSRRTSRRPYRRTYNMRYGRNYRYA